MPETIGQQLKQTRTARNLTVKNVTQATHIQARLIEAMEADEFDSLPSPVQARAFLRIYAEFLELSLDGLITRQRAGADEPPVALLKAAPAPVQIQAPEEGADSSSVTGPVLEPRKTKSPLNLHIRHALPKPKKTTAPVESAGQTATSEPIAVTQDESVVSEEETSASSRTETLLAPDKISSERQSQIIFKRIGEELHRRREILSLTLDEIEHHTHVRMHYLQALEVGELNHLPSSVQARGMLSNYAHFLDMDVDAILLEFAEGLQAQRLERQPMLVEKSRNMVARSPSRNVPPSGLRRFFSMDILVGGGLVLILLVFAIWGTSRVIGSRSARTPQPTAQSISDILAASPEADTTASVATIAPGSVAIIPVVSSTAIVTVPVAGQGPVQIVIVALEESFVRVTVDGKKLFDGRVAAGTAYPFDGKTSIEILTGNGAAVSILFNQSDLGPMGSIGEVVDRIYTANAIMNPTATFTPSPTITPIHSLTPTPSPTPHSSSPTQTPVATQSQ